MNSYFNFLRRNALYTAVNLLGLSLSLAFLLLVGVYVSGELSVEAANENKDRIYRLETENMTEFPAVVDRDVLQYLPSVDAVTRFYRNATTVTRPDGLKSLRARLFVDSTFLGFFPTPMLAGGWCVAMDQVVLTETYARSEFGSPTGAVGQTLVIDTLPYVVSGVVADYGGGSLIENAPIITRFENVNHIWDGYLKGYDAANFMIFVRLIEGAAVPTDRLAALTQHFKGCYWIFQLEQSKELRLQPLDEVYWGEPMAGVQSNERSFVAILIACVLAVLVFAVINYVNLTVAQTHLRARQAAMQRLLGCSRGVIFGDFMVEALVMCGAASGVALVLAYGVAPWFGGVVGQPMLAHSIFSPDALLLLLGLLVLLTLVTGLAPALTAMRFEPIRIVRGDFARRVNTLYGRLAIGVQFVVTMVLVGMTLLFLRQTNHMISSDLGFDADQLLVVELNLPGQRIDAWGAFLKGRSSSVRSVSLATGAPFVDDNMLNGEIDGQTYSFRVIMADSAYVQTMGFTPVRVTGIQGPGSVWVNQTAARKLDLADDATEIPWWNGRKLPLRGVLADFYQRTMTDPIHELIVGDLRAPFAGDGQPYVALVRVETTDPIATQKQIEALWSEFTQGEPFLAHWLDQTIEEVYQTERRTSTLVGLLSVLAVVISAMGILAASISAVRQKRKEIAVRKIYGSSVGEVFVRLIRAYIAVWAVAAVVALPVVWVLAQGWLEQFAYRVAVGVELVAAALGVLAVAMGCLGIQIGHAARAQPAQSLKTE